MAPTPTVTVTMVSLGLFPLPLETFCPKLFDLRGLLLVPVRSIQLERSKMPEEHARNMLKFLYKMGTKNMWICIWF